MDLVIDFGTTSGKAGFFKGEDIVRKLTGLKIDDLAGLTADNEVNNLVISTVTHPAEEIAGRITYSGKAVYMDHKLKMPITINYQTPETLGRDRLAAAVGAYSLFPERDVLVIDAGTCITYEFISATAVYKGGGISPGINLRFRSVHNYTEHLPLMEKTDNVELIGDSTGSAIQSGVLWGVMAEIREIIRMYRDKFPLLQLVICGGDSLYISERLSEDHHLSPDLVLKGLKTVLEYNV